MSDSNKIKILAVAIVAAIVVAIVTVVAMYSRINVQNEIRAEKNRIFLHSEIVELDLNWEAMESFAERDKAQNGLLTKEKNRTIATKSDELNKNPQLQDAAIRINNDIISKKDIEEIRLQLVYEQYAYSQDYEMWLRNKIIEKVRDVVLDQEIERKTKQPSSKERDEYMQKAIEDFAPGGKQREEFLKYLSVNLKTEEEYWKETEKQIVTELRQGELSQRLMSENEMEIKQEAIRRGITDHECFAQWFWPKYIDGLVSKAEIEILDPELKVLFGIAE